MSLGGRYENIPAAPVIADVFFQPVLFESPVSMTGTYLDDGRGLLVWTNGGNIRYGFVDSPMSWAGNGTCTAGFTAVTSATLGADAQTACCFRVGGDLFIHAEGQTFGATAAIRVYKANSASNPTSWSLHGTLQSVGSQVSGFPFGQPCVGLPWVDGSVWIMPSMVFSFTFTEYLPLSAMWRSTDSGVTWSMVFAQGYGTFGITDVGGSSGTNIVSDPADRSSLYWGNPGSGTNQFTLWKSTNLGVSWTNVQDNISTKPVPHFDDGTTMYGLRREIDRMRAYIQFPSFPDVSVHTDRVDFGSGRPIHSHWCADKTHTDPQRTLYLFNSDRVWLTARGGWQVGSVALG